MLDALADFFRAGGPVMYPIALASLIAWWLAFACFARTARALAGTAVVFKRTLFGIAVRGAAEDFDAARLMGVKANRVITGAFAYAGLLAARDQFTAWQAAPLGDLPRRRHRPAIHACCASGSRICARARRKSTSTSP